MDQKLLFFHLSIALSFLHNPTHSRSNAIRRSIMQGFARGISRKTHEKQRNRANGITCLFQLAFMCCSCFFRLSNGSHSFSCSCHVCNSCSKLARMYIESLCKKHGFSLKKVKHFLKNATVKTYNRHGLGHIYHIVHGNLAGNFKKSKVAGCICYFVQFWTWQPNRSLFLPYPSRTVVSNKSEPNTKERTVMIILFWVVFGLWPSLRFGRGNFSVSVSGKGVSHHMLWSWLGLFFRFGSWKSMLDPSTWGLPHLSLRVAELGAPGNLGAPGLQSEKRRATLLNMFENFLFSYVLFEECMFAMFGYWTWHFLAHSCCISFREGGLSSYAVKLTGTCFCLCCSLETKIDISPTFHRKFATAENTCAYHQLSLFFGRPPG